MTTTCALTSQVQLGVLSVFSIVLPPSYESFLLRLSLWEVQLPFNCMFPFTFASKLLMKTLGPFFVFSVLFLLASIAKLTAIWNCGNGSCFASLQIARSAPSGWMPSPPSL